jgi:hypothetical protein
MNMHWQEAQARARASSGTNIVFLPDGKAALVGHAARGWLVVTPERGMAARTAEGVQLVLEELRLPALGWR